MSSKNNPSNRDKMTLIVKCPESGKPMKIVKLVPGGMHYKSEQTGKYYPLSKGCYKNFEHEWIRKR